MDVALYIRGGEVGGRGCLAHIADYDRAGEPYRGYALGESKQEDGLVILTGTGEGRPGQTVVHSGPMR